MAAFHDICELESRIGIAAVAQRVYTHLYQDSWSLNHASLVRPRFKIRRITIKIKKILRSLRFYVIGAAKSLGSLELDPVDIE